MKGNSEFLIWMNPRTADLGIQPGTHEVLTFPCDSADPFGKANADTCSLQNLDEMQTVPHLKIIFIYRFWRNGGYITDKPSYPQNPYPSHAWTLTTWGGCWTLLWRKKSPSTSMIGRRVPGSGCVCCLKLYPFYLALKGINKESRIAVCRSKSDF